MDCIDCTYCDWHYWGVPYWIKKKIGFASSRTCFSLAISRSTSALGVWLF